MLHAQTIEQRYVVREFPTVEDGPHAGLQKLQQRYGNKTRADLPTISISTLAFREMHALRPDGFGVQEVHCQSHVRSTVRRSYEWNPHTTGRFPPATSALASEQSPVLGRGDAGPRPVSAMLSDSGRGGFFDPPAAFSKSVRRIRQRHLDTDH